MTPAFALVIVLAAQAPASASSTSTAASAANAPAASDDTPLELDQLRQMYRDTCEAREFGAYDDMCDQLRLQVRAAERRAARDARQRPQAASAASASPKPSPTPP